MTTNKIAYDLSFPFFCVIFLLLHIIGCCCNLFLLLLLLLLVFCCYFCCCCYLIFFNVVVVLIIFTFCFDKNFVTTKFFSDCIFYPPLFFLFIRLFANLLLALPWLLFSTPTQTHSHTKHVHLTQQQPHTHTYITSSGNKVSCKG